MNIPDRVLGFLCYGKARTNSTASVFLAALPGIFRDSTRVRYSVILNERGVLKGRRDGVYPRGRKSSDDVRRHIEPFLLLSTQFAC